MEAKKREKAFLATRFGSSFDTTNVLAAEVDRSPKYIQKAIKASLKRLKTNYIDLYYLHRADPKILIEETLSRMADLAKQGKILH